MKLTYFLPVGLLAAAVVMIQPQSLAALTAQEVDAIAKEITVRIDGQDDASSGSGIIIERNGDNYLVLTNWHVVEGKGDYTIYPREGRARRYTVKSSQVQRLPGVDLAVLVFNSSTNYQTASIGNANQLQNGMKLRITGFPVQGPTIRERTYISLSGEMSGRLSKPHDGYELISSVSALSGMSGGPILNENGEVVGVTGLGEVDARTRNVSLGLGIPINTYQRLAANIKTLLPQNASPPTENFFNIGFAKSEKGDHRGAIVAYTEAIRLNPNYADAYYNRGVVRNKSGDKQGAITDYNQAIGINPNHALAYNNRGFARSALGDKQGAITDYNQAIRINPNHALAYNNRGFARSELGDKQGAITDYNQAILLNPNLALAYNNRGVFRSESGDKQGAITDYNQAIQINPNFALAYHNRGNARYELGDKQGAINDYNQAIRINPNLALTY